uniref:Cytochrome P450 monooxygenase sirE n=2 Tax=Leptosphaeria maculans TaxID=5022 RepID=SIRE_LEPMC|nr:RecName: Full=Cytochrome P450 monooxygenase sirE; AltName: Full=Sirodesmin biosynthesis protein E [Plenodomus lingam]AAS92549.1 SirE [Plenodomus lingam]
MFFRYTVTLVANETDHHATVVQALLRRHIGDITPGTTQEIENALETVCGQSKEWSSTSLAAIIIAVVARSTSRLLVGPSLCRNNDYINLCIEYATEMESSAAKIRALVPFLRPLIAPYYCRRLAELRKLAHAHIAPLLAGPDSAPKEKNASSQYTAVQWLAQKLRGVPEETEERQVARIMFLNVISIFTVMMASLNVLYDILARPDVKRALLEEIAEVSGGKGDLGLGDVEFERLRRLDSCIRESQRLNPTNWIILEGQAQKDLTFSTGLCVEKGSYLSICGGAILKSNGPPLSTSSNPPPIDEFHAFRYVTPDSGISTDVSTANGNSNANSNLATAISPTNLTFGYGRMSCPGRYFAVHSIKAIVVGLLLRYDVEFEKKDGEERGRPRNVQAGNVIIPDPSVMVRVRARG